MNILNDYGVVLSGQEIVEYAKRRGLCQICGRTQTHKRPNNLFQKLRNQWQPLTILDGGDDQYNNNDDDASNSQMYLVYKGYCLQPTCYTLEEAKRELGEIAVVVTEESCMDGVLSQRSLTSEQVSKSLRRFSSSKFSSSSARSYEFSILDRPKLNQQQHNPMTYHHSRLLLHPTSSSLSDVLSLGASERLCTTAETTTVYHCTICIIQLTATAIGQRLGGRFLLPLSTIHDDTVHDDTIQYNNNN
jgi:hypothetical protein